MAQAGFHGPAGAYIAKDYAIFILVFFPICLYVTVKIRDTIHAL